MTIVQSGRALSAPSPDHAGGAQSVPADDPNGGTMSHNATGRLSHAGHAGSTCVRSCSERDRADAVAASLGAAQSGSQLTGKPEEEQGAEHEQSAPSHHRVLVAEIRHHDLGRRALLRSIGNALHDDDPGDDQQRPSVDRPPASRHS